MSRNYAYSTRDGDLLAELQHTEEKGMTKVKFEFVLGIVLLIASNPVFAEMDGDKLFQQFSADGDGCTRARREQGVLRGLRAYRFEQAPERREIEQAILPDGIPVTIVYSGCHHSSAHYRFRLDSEPATQIGTNALEIAAQLMRSLADASASRGIGSLASKIAEAAAEGKYGLDDDVTGGYWEEYKAVGVSLESEPGSRAMVVKHHIVM